VQLGKEGKQRNNKEITSVYEINHLNTGSVHHLVKKITDFNTSQRGSGGLIPGNIQGRDGRCSEQPGLVEDVPAHCSGVGLDNL